MVEIQPFVSLVLILLMGGQFMVCSDNIHAVWIHLKVLTWPYAVCRASQGHRGYEVGVPQTSWSLWWIVAFRPPVRCCSSHLPLFLPPFQPSRSLSSRCLSCPQLAGSWLHLELLDLSHPFFSGLKLFVNMILNFFKVILIKMTYFLDMWDIGLKCATLFLFVLVNRLHYVDFFTQ